MLCNNCFIISYPLFSWEQTCSGHPSLPHAQVRRAQFSPCLPTSSHSSRSYPRPISVPPKSAAHSSAPHLLQLSITCGCPFPSVPGAFTLLIPPHRTPPLLLQYWDDVLSGKSYVQHSYSTPFSSFVHTCTSVISHQW